MIKTVCRYEKTEYKSGTPHFALNAAFLYFEWREINEVVYFLILFIHDKYGEFMAIPCLFMVKYK